MMKQQLNEIYNNLKIEYRRVKRKRGKLLPYWLIIIAIVAGFFVYANEARKGREDMYKSLNQIQQRLDNVDKSFKSIDKRFKDQDNKIEQTKEAKARRAEEARLASIQSARPQPVQRVRPNTGGVEQWRALVAKYFPADQVDNALKIMTLESGGNPNSLSRTCDRGLMQINCVHAARVGGNLAALFDPDTNLRVAVNIWAAQGWRPWSTARKAGLI